MIFELNDKIRLQGWTFTCKVYSLSRSAVHAIYAGDQLGRPQRGIAVVLTQGAEASERSRVSAAWAAQGFADGYFGVAPTLSPARAAGQALDAINNWLFAQGWSKNQQSDAHVNFSAVTVVGRRLGFVCVGDSSIYRWRQKRMLPANEQSDSGSSSRAAAPLGVAHNVGIEYFEAEAQSGDRYVVATGPAPKEIIEAVCRGESPQENPSYSLLCLDIEDLPPLSFGDVKAEIENLPLCDPPQEGETLDGFIIGRTIYRSRNTLLRRAHDTVENREVVLKFPLPAMLEDKVIQAGFIREALVGRSVNSKWVAEYLELASGRQSCLYIVVPFYRGETLETRLLQQPAVGFAEGMSVALRTCAAVDDLNRLQVIHRDLKPENIILLNEGGLRLLDLGLAYLPGIDDAAEDQMGGSTRYMAPELFKGETPGPRSEVFSLGVLIYRMFSGGYFPFGQWESQPLSRKRPDLPIWLGRCLSCALSVDPAQRFASAAEFASALEKNLIEGDSRPFARSRWRTYYNSVRLWRAVSVLFALAFIMALVFLYRR